MTFFMKMYIKNTNNLYIKIVSQVSRVLRTYLRWRIMFRVSVIPETSIVLKTHVTTYIFCLKIIKIDNLINLKRTNRNPEISTVGDHAAWIPFCALYKGHF